MQWPVEARVTGSTTQLQRELTQAARGRARERRRSGVLWPQDGEDKERGDSEAPISGE
jgi:hypothetical protein